MKIGIDCRMYSTQFTGIGRYVFELTRHLFQLDQKNEYVLFFNNPQFSQFEPPSEKIKKVLVNAKHYSLQEQTNFLRLLNRENLDLMHFTHFNAPIFYKKPFIVTIHDLTLSFYPGKKMNSFLYRAAYNKTVSSAVKNSKKIIAVSKNTKKDIRDLYKIEPEKIEVIYEGVDQNFHPNIEEHKIKTTLEKYKIHRPYLLYTGVWRSHKNLPRLIKAFHILKSEYGFDGDLVITGRYDPLYAPDILQNITSLKLEPNIIFTGMVDEEELIALYNGAEVYTFPSLYEGFGLSPLEAMQCGTPVAASNASCIPEVCGEKNALFFDPKNPYDMAEKIFRIFSEKTLREDLITRGLKHVKTFSWKKMAEETLKIYTDVRTVS
jgi:glycosyltransferase involved in cell wall biosynthesis